MTTRYHIASWSLVASSISKQFYSFPLKSSFSLYGRVLICIILVTAEIAWRGVDHYYSRGFDHFPVVGKCHLASCLLLFYISSYLKNHFPSPTSPLLLPKPTRFSISLAETPKLSHHSYFSHFFHLVLPSWSTQPSSQPNLVPNPHGQPNPTQTNPLNSQPHSDHLFVSKSHFWLKGIWSTQPLICSLMCCFQWLPVHLLQVCGNHLPRFSSKKADGHQCRIAVKGRQLWSPALGHITNAILPRFLLSPLQKAIPVCTVNNIHIFQSLLCILQHLHMYLSL